MKHGEIKIVEYDGNDNEIVVFGVDGKLISSGVTVDSISGGSSNISIHPGFGIQIIESPVDTFTISVSSDFITVSEVASVSGQLISYTDSASANALAQANAYSDSLETDLSGYALTSTVAAVSAGLDARIVTLEGNPVPDIFATEVASISSGLQNQINNIVQESTSITSSGGSITITSSGGANYNIEVASAPISNHNDLSGLQGGTTGEYYHLSASQFSDYIGRTEVASTSGQLVSYTDSASANALAHAIAYADTIETDLSNYALTATVADISGNLQNQINNIVQESTSVSSSSGNIIVQNYLNNWDVSVADYISKSEVASVSGYLITYTDSLEPDLSGYALTATVAAISAGIDSRLDVVESRPVPDIFRTEVAAISAGLQSEIDNIVIPDVSVYATKVEVNEISGGFDSRLNTLETEDYVHTINGLTSNITLQAGSSIGIYPINSTTIGISGSGGGITSDYSGNSLYNFKADVLEISGNILLNPDVHMARVINTTGPTTFTVPNNLPKGFSVTIAQFDPGVVNISAGSGAIIRDRLNRNKLGGLYAVGTIITVRNPNGTSSISVLGGDLTT